MLIYLFFVFFVFKELLDDVGIEVLLAKVKKDREQGFMDGHLSAVSLTIK